MEDVLKGNVMKPVEVVHNMWQFVYRKTNIRNPCCTGQLKKVQEYDLDFFIYRAYEFSLSPIAKKSTFHQKRLIWNGISAYCFVLNSFKANVV